MIASLETRSLRSTAFAPSSNASFSGSVVSAPPIDPERVARALERLGARRSGFDFDPLPAVELGSWAERAALEVAIEAQRDPRAAMSRGVAQRAFWSQADIDENLAATYPGSPNAAALMRELALGIGCANGVLGLALAGHPRSDLIAALGGPGRPGAEAFVRHIEALAGAIRSGDPSRIQSSAIRANWGMVDFLAAGDGEKRRELGTLMSSALGIPAHGARFYGQGAFGDPIATAAPDALAIPDGQFRASAPSEVGAKALEAARSQLGVREATGNNDGLPSQRYAGGRSEPWCADFVTWSLRQSDPEAARRYGSPSVAVMEGKMKAAGRWQPRDRASPQPGDVIFFANRGASDRGTGRHVGIVEKVENGRVYTIEGNTGNAVQRRSYSLSDPRITGYGRP